ncbi:MAG: hypothetical protein ACYCV6_01550 [Steroidobacteraceae bacterium]
MAAFSIAGPQFGGKTIRTHVDPPKHPKLSIRRMTTSDLKVLQAILSEELRVVRVTADDLLASGWNATDRQVRGMETRLTEIEEEITRRNLRDLKNGRTGWTRPRHSRGAFAVSLAEAAKIH